MPIVGASTTSNGLRTFQASPDAEIGANNIPLARPDNVHIATSPLPQAWNSWPSILSYNSSEVTVNSNAASLKQVEKRWAAYVERRWKEWAILISVAGAILV
ncbi:hypothetical protein C0991_001747, partial [Blastosporella zonata]